MGKKFFGYLIMVTGIFWQKIDYILYNPVEAGVCNYSEDYNYSSARFYLNKDETWDFLTHHNG